VRQQFVTSGQNATTRSTSTGPSFICPLEASYLKKELLPA
jgi:hypothetical protein